MTSDQEIIEKVRKKINNIKRQHCDGCEIDYVCNICFPMFIETTTKEAIKLARQDERQKVAQEIFDYLENSRIYFNTECNACYGREAYINSKVKEIKQKFLNQSPQTKPDNPTGEFSLHENGKENANQDKPEDIQSQETNSAHLSAHGKVRKGRTVSPNSESRPDNLSLCPHCHCMSKTFSKIRCAKCKKYKVQKEEEK